MMRQNLRAVLCLATLAAMCSPATAQNAPATGTTQSPVQSTPQPDAQAAPTPPNPSEPAPSLPDLPPASLPTQIAALLDDPAVSRSHWGIMVTSLDGALIYGLNQTQLFQPASNTKLFTTAAALALLGPQATFTTRVTTLGTITKGRLHGDLVLKGDGDANLSARQLPYTPSSGSARQDSPPPNPLRFIDDLADQIAGSGLKAIDGNILGDDTLFPWEPYPEDWSIDDAVWGYGAPVSALSLNDNQIKLTIAPGILPPVVSAHQIGNTPAGVTLDPDLPYYAIENDAVTVDPKSKWSIGIDREPGSHTIRIYGAIAADAAPDVEEVAIDDPAVYAALSLKQALVARGIAVLGDAHAQHRIPSDTISFLAESHSAIPNLEIGGGGKLMPCLRCGQSLGPGPVLAKHLSDPLQEDIVLTNKLSSNLHAELLLHQLAVTYGDTSNNGSTAEGARVLRQFLINAGLDPHDFIFFDGSGLSNHDLVTPRATAKLLQFATTQPWFAAWKASLPIGGEDGTLEGRFANPPLKDHVFAKTGTLGEARALSGYLDTASGRTVIFSIMVGNHLPGTSADRDAMDKIVAAIAAAE
jgi:D-alanyl-D-alanine carboxypeptidase/D-alanyl-D-alanine-endopeptidase (penicillin-binding protein 4)